VKKNSDGSYDIYFGPKPSEDKLEYRDAAEALRRDPEQRFLAMRLYNPTTEARSQLLDTGNSGQRWCALDNLSAASYAIQHRPITAVD